MPPRFFLLRRPVPAAEFGTCPTCNRPLGVTFRREGRIRGLLHDLPVCGTFERMSPPAFLDHVLILRALPPSPGVA